MLVFFSLGVGLTAFVVLNPLDLDFLPQLSSEAEATAENADTGEGEIYQCPMHPEVIESHPDDCPICGMDLVQLKQSGASRPADAGEIYQCPMHPEVIESQPADCPICGMDLVAVRQSGGSRSDEDREVLYWYAPMDPTYVRDEPGLSPMGMKLVPKYADQEGARGGRVIHIDPTQVQNIGVVSESARLQDIARTSRTVGILDFNADRVTWINTKFEGWIEKVHVNYVGQDVQADQPLFEIYSPELVTTQEEYLRALDYQVSLENSSRRETRSQAESLVRSTRERLAYWDVSQDQIERLERTRQVQRRLTVFSPAAGVVAGVMDEALEGMYVRPGMNLYKIADLSTIWVHADVFESDLPWIKAGQPAFVSFPNDPDTTYRGSILFLYPEVSSDTRTLKICVEVPNDRGRLRPGMYADVVVSGPLIRNAVVIPRSALIRSGERDIVFIDQGGGYFLPQEVLIGPAGEAGMVQVARGVQPGQSVVVRAQFMLDSESRIQEAIAKFMQREPAAPSDSGKRR